MKLKNLLVVLFLVIAGNAMAQMMPPLPQDKDVRTGKLDNGLTYYIRYNNWPENRAEFFIAQRVGSLQEDESQRGLAHFLEHMCFNGTKHFKGNDLIRYCESIGVKFGEDLNAYTSVDRTVYNISNVPTNNKASLDSCLLILYDWADGLVLDEKEIDKERGVIHEEWRLRSSAQQRMLERSLPTLYPGSKYGLRMPIGLMSVVDGFKPIELRNYYEKWYRPDNQAIIVVGDVDVDHVEAEIKRLFSGIVVPKNAAQVWNEPVPDTDEPIVVVEKDKEQPNNVASFMFKHDVFPDSLKNTQLYLVNGFLKNAAISMLNQRISELTKKPDCPFVGAQVGDGTYIFSKTKDAFTLNYAPKDGKNKESAKAVFCEALRAAEFGFTATEFQRFKDNMLSGLENMYANKDKRYSNQFAQEYVEVYLENEPMVSFDDEYMMMKQMIPMIPVDAVNQYIKELMPMDNKNLVILSTNVEKEGAVYPEAKEFLTAIDEARAEKLEAFVDNVKNEPLITELPQKGSIVKEKAGKKFGYKELTLSNGVRVLLKKTDFKKDEIVMTGTGEGGSSLYSDKDLVNLNVFNDVIGASGLGNFSTTELRKALAGKVANCDLSMGERRMSVSGSAVKKDMETMFQLLYLYFTNIKKDEENLQLLKQSYEMSLKNKANNPDAAFQDSVSYTISNHHPRAKSMEMSDIAKIDYDRILQIAKERTANAAAYRFTIVGDFDEAELRPLIERYIASLPSSKKIVKGHKVVESTDDNVINRFTRKSEQPKANAVMVWLNKKMPYSMESSIQASIAGQILSMIYLNKIREEAGAAYSCGASGMMSKTDKDVTTMMQAICPMKPEKAEEAIKIMREEVPALAENCDADMLTKVKEYMLKSADDAVKTNGYWMNVINTYDRYGLDNHTEYKNTVAAQTPEKICNFMKKFLKGANLVQVIMLPEE